MHKRSHLRSIAIAVFVIVMTVWNYSRISGGECIRAIHVVTLLTCGAAIGVALTNLFLLARSR
ncbi:MAG: hypothetical protein ABJA57_01100 [Ginsengibacter sp.]